MKPIDYRNDTWEMVQGRMLADERYKVWQAFRHHGPGTTREVATRSGIDLLNLRPRATELYQLGFLILVASIPDQTHEGIYTALGYDQAREKFHDAKRNASGYQTELQLK
jgi:hypothetical protein